MAVFRAPTEKTFTIERFLGLNECPDGDTGLKLGEAASMKNFRITKDYNLQTRPCVHLLATISANKPIRKLWYGYVNATAVFLAVCNGHVYTIDTNAWTAASIGTLTDADTEILAYNENVYFLNGHEFKYWDGTTFGNAGRYRPLIYHTCAPATGSGAGVEQINLLNGLRRIQYNGTVGTTVYQLPETAITSIDKTIVNGSVTTAYTVDLTTGAVTFTVAPGEGTDNVEIWYTKGTGDSSILAYTHCETFMGGADNRVFFYGNGTNQLHYSGLDYVTGNPEVEYIPALNFMNIDSANTPVTSLIRHGTTMLALKTDGAYAVFYDGTLTDAEGNPAPNFNYKPINREIGNEALGQVRLVSNSPISLFDNGVYEWKSVTIRDERNAERISDRIRATLETFTLAGAKTFDDSYNSEYWICYGTNALIWNYAVDAWYEYTDLSISCMVRVGSNLYLGMTDGTIHDFSRGYLNDNGTAVDCQWASGSMAFGAETLYKSLYDTYISLRPEVGSIVTVGIDTESSTFTKEFNAENACFSYVHFNYVHFTYNTNHRPQSKKLKLKIRKFVYGKVTISVHDLLTSATITSLSLPVTYDGKAR